MRKILVLILLGVILGFPSSALALKERVRRGGTTTSAATRTSSRLGVASSVKFRSDRRALVVTFSDLGKTSQISYTLTYTGSGVSQGVSGTIKPAGEPSISRELVFGTCSAGVCRYHTGITNARLVITSWLKNGRKVNKGYKIKV